VPKLRPPLRGGSSNFWTLHGSIGRHSNQEGIHIELPTRKDWVKIMCVTLIFAIFQGYLTYLFN
jgi:hypothetical protein